jgi:hypothetical protein
VTPSLYILTDNTYYSDNPFPFLVNPTPLNFSQWFVQRDEVNTHFEQLSYPDPERTIGTYMAGLGAPASVNLFLAIAATQSRHTWRPEFTAAVVNAYIRDGFGQPIIEPCVVDMNGDGAFDIQDYMAFEQYLATGDPRADLNRDGRNTLTDILAFNAIALQGCP